MSIRNVIEDAIHNSPFYARFPNDGQKFIAWYVKNIFSLNEDDTMDCITDGPNDKQIDAIYIDKHNNAVHIIQGKYYSEDHNTTNATPIREVTSSWLQILNLENLQNNANDKLREKIPDLFTAMEDDYEFIFELIVTSSLTEQANNDCESFKETLASDNMPLQAHLEVIDESMLEARYNDALNINTPAINHEFSIEKNKCLELNISNSKVVIAAIKLGECVDIPGIRERTLFRKNVRESLGRTVKVNKGIEKTIKESPKEFFFLHNGITAICESMEFNDDKLSVKGLNVVNGCQSLSTIFLNSQTVKRNANEAYILFRFYEINDPERADSISKYTNSQSAVTARDLHSNDKCIRAIKKSYEDMFTNGYFITKRGEKARDNADKDHIIDLPMLAKWLMTWYSQRPYVSYSEKKLFEVYYNQLFGTNRKYSPRDIQALNSIFRELDRYWGTDDCKSLAPSKSKLINHHMYTLSALLSKFNDKSEDEVPLPSEALDKLQNNNCMNNIVKFSYTVLSKAVKEAEKRIKKENEKAFFSVAEWSKLTSSISDINSSMDTILEAQELLPGGSEYINGLKELLHIDTFEKKWSADHNS